MTATKDATWMGRWWRNVVLGTDRGRPPSVGGLILRGLAIGYLAVMIVLPLGALGLEAIRSGPSALLSALLDPFARHALVLTLTTAAVMTVINAVMGTLTAWVIARREFVGKRWVNAFIDLPLAIPTVVTGLMLVTLYGPTSVLGTVLGGSIIYQQPGIILALVFVTFPFVVRSVQPVLLELDPVEEEAAATLGAGPWLTFRRVVLPTLAPAIFSGAAQSFARALGEFGSVVLVSGNRPLETTTAPLYIYGALESGDRTGALAVSLALLAGSLGLMLVFNVVQTGKTGS
jgi:sulfate transport system permease protein